MQSYRKVHKLFVTLLSLDNRASEETLGFSRIADCLINNRARKSAIVCSSLIHNGLPISPGLFVIGFAV